jgi:hypothetical protein
MSAPFNPARRNRNIGTPKQGHGQDNRMSVPQPAGTARRTARLNLHAQLTRTIGGKEVSFLVEHTSGGCVHACTIEDLCYMLSQVPSADWAGLATFVLRQSTRKERLLNPIWGRLLYHADLETSDNGLVRSGPAVFLEACDLRTPIKWSTSLDPEDSEELKRLRSDGHRVERIGKRHIISSTVDSARATQLYRTMLHEIGHWFDWLEKVEGPAARGEDCARLADTYFARPKSEREAFAHRYADDLRQKLLDKRVIPFQRIAE